MEAAPINELLTREPFSPFRIKFSKQESVVIRNPDLVVVMKRDLFVADPSRDRFHLYALIHVVGVETLGNGHPSGLRRRKRR